MDTRITRPYVQTRPLVVVLTIATVVAVGCKRRAPKTQPAEVEMAEADSQRWRVGRFAFELPSGFVPLEQRRQIYFTRLVVEPLSTENTVKDCWQRRLSETQARQDVVSSRETKIDPGMRALYYETEDDEGTTNLVAQLASSDHVLWLTTHGIAAKHEMMERLFGKIARGYVPDDVPGFWSGAGALTTKPGRTENAEIRLVDSELGIEIEIYTRAVQGASSANPLNDVDEAFDAMKVLGATGQVLMNRKRELIGLEGFEGGVSVKGEDSKDLMYSWVYLGAPFEALKPKFSVKANAPANRQKELDTIWEHLLESLHVVGSQK